MNVPCARCKKTVYTVEKLNCLDKIWHKACFTCETCNLKLTMKSYKGYNKLPYCVTHYPTTKFTAVADTPENKRLQKQTQNQSNLQYHKDHKQSLQQFTAVDDSPASRTCKKNQMNVSQANYTNRAESRDKQEAARVAAGSDQPPPPQQGYGMDPVDYNPAEELETALGSVWRGAVQPSFSQPPPQSQVAPPPQPPSGPKYRAVYDYCAADPDEVSFQEGDIILDPNIIDDGWMEGRVERTGQFGMLPSNYVEKC